MAAIPCTSTQEPCTTVQDNSQRARKDDHAASLREQGKGYVKPARLGEERRLLLSMAAAAAMAAASKKKKKCSIPWSEGGNENSTVRMGDWI